MSTETRYISKTINTYVTDVILIRKTVMQTNKINLVSSFIGLFLLDDYVGAVRWCCLHMFYSKQLSPQKSYIAFNKNVKA